MIILAEAHPGAGQRHAKNTSHLGGFPADSREQISERIEQLLESPRQPGDSYDELTDQWTTTYGGGSGLIVSAVVHKRQRVIILRLV